jgi:4-hydroxybenzoate polyprenyltransferase
MSNTVLSDTEPAAGSNATELIGRFLQLIRFSHTVFALPFALGALVVAANRLPSARVFFLVLACMVCARTAAMLFNRLADWSLDQRNPRTASRHQLVPRAMATVGLIVAAAGFLLSAGFLNRLTLLLSPIALVIIFFYSLTKRFTSLTHFFLGLALAIAPVGAWIAQTGSIHRAPLILAAAVMCWVAGFDVIYATQDYEFDRKENLRSLVVALGVQRSLQFAQLLHLFALVGLIFFGVSARLGVCYFGAMPLILATLFFEHHHARRLDVAAINRAFFQSNAFVSVVFLVAVCLDRLT